MLPVPDYRCCKHPNPLESLALGLGSGDLCRHLSALQHLGAQQPQAEKGPDEEALESPGQGAVCLISVSNCCHWTSPWVARMHKVWVLSSLFISFFLPHSFYTPLILFPLLSVSTLPSSGPGPSSGSQTTLD